MTVRSWFALWCVGWALIVAISLVPGAYLAPLLQFPHAETTLHFAGCAFIVASAALFCRRPAALAAIALISAAVATTLELLQFMVPERGPSLSDAAANAAGAAVGYVVAWIAGRLGRAHHRPVRGSQAEEG